MGELETVRRYLELVSAHRVEEALECLSPDFELSFAGSGFRLDRDSASRALEWDVGPNGRLEWQILAIAPLVAWAEANEPDVLDVVYPNGQMTYSGEMARQWLALARRWRATQ